MELSIYCPYCNRYVELSLREKLFNAGSNGNYAMGQCNSCHKVVLIHFIGGCKEIFPLPSHEPVDNRIIEPVRRDFEEANKCMTINAYRAGSVMARRSLQSICLDKGANEKDDLYHQIDWMFGQGIITRDIKDWAHEVRLVGNDAAHPKKPDDDIPVTQEDAKDILDLLEQFCQVLYVAPAIAQERKKARQKPCVTTP